MPSQLILPLATQPALGREDFIVGPANREAAAFIDSYPNWSAPAAALYGPSGSGKSHLAAAWAAAAGAAIAEATALDDGKLAHLSPGQPIVLENIDSAALGPAQEAAIFALLERGAPVLLTGRELPGTWPARLPDLASRYRALLAFALWAPDEALLSALAHKLFADRQLAVPDTVVAQMIRFLERSPASIRDFVARADAKALAEHRPITVALVREMMTQTH